MRISLLLLTALVSGLSGSALAETINSVGSTSSSNNWNTASIWSNNMSPSAGNDYISTHTLRTAATFAGDSLRVDSGGIVALKVTTTTHANLHMNGGTIQNFFNDNTAAALAGELFIDANTGISAGDPDNRNTAIAATLHGSAEISTNSSFANGTSRVTITGANNPFTGDWRVTGGLLVADAAGSLGDFGTLTINAGGNFNANYDIDQPGAGLVLNGGMILDQSHSFGSVNIAGTPLTAGFHSFDDLNAQFDANFADAGSGGITVVPEPAGLGVIAVAGLPLVRRRRKHA